MNELRETNCRSCGAPVYFVPTAKGKRAIVDVRRVRVWIELGDGAFRAVSGYEDHHATCPQEKEWRN